MIFMILLLSFLLLKPASSNPNRLSQDDERYLRNFGYFNKEGVSPQGRNAADILPNADKDIDTNEALRKFQSFNGLPITGFLDKETKEYFTKPRCGVPDIIVRPRDATAYHWKKSKLTWNVLNHPSQLSMGETRRNLDLAFTEWSKHIPLQFNEVSPYDTSPDFEILFGRRHHGDPWPFDGRGRVLAHAMLPSDGRVHFDSDEPWDGKVDLYTVALHEIGHALGLSHSRDKDSIMVPYYRYGNTSPKLSFHDIEQIQKMYGKGEKEKNEATMKPPPPATTTPSIKPTKKFKKNPGDKPSTKPNLKLCIRSVTAAAKGMNGREYIFSHGLVYEANERGVWQKKAKPVAMLFPKIRSVQAAVTNPRTSTTLLFHGGKVWAYSWNSKTELFELKNGYPKQISSKIPFQPTGAFLWRDGNVILVKGDRFATYDVNWNVPTMINSVENYFPNLPTSIIGVLPSKHRNLIHAFLPNNRVQLYNMNTKQIQKNSDRDIERILKC